MEYKVGDVVINIWDEKGVITKVDEDIVYILWKDGSCGRHDKDHAKTLLAKTNRSVDILDVLVKIK